MHQKMLSNGYGHKCTSSRSGVARYERKIIETPFQTLRTGGSHWIALLRMSIRGSHLLPTSRYCNFLLKTIWMVTRNATEIKMWRSSRVICQFSRRICSNFAIVLSEIENHSLISSSRISGWSPAINNCIICEPASFANLFDIDAGSPTLFH